MRYLISPSEIGFFQKHGCITFEDLISVEGIEAEVEKYPEFATQHRLFTKSRKIAELSKNRRLAKIAKELSGEKQIRLLFDQGFLLNASFPKAFKNPIVFEESASYQGLFALLLLQLSPQKGEEIEEVSENVPLPQKQGSGVFFSPKKPFLLPEEKTSSYLLIGYGKSSTICTKNPLDPFQVATNSAHHLKNPGEKVSDQECPLLL